MTEYGGNVEHVEEDPSTSLFKQYFHPTQLTIKCVKKLNWQHCHDVEKLITDENRDFFNKLFGFCSPEYHLVKRLITFGAYNDEDDLVGLISFDIFPNIPAVPPWDWPNFIHKLYRISDLTPYRTIWIFYSCWNTKYCNIFAKPIIQKLFERFEYFHNAVMVCPPGCSSSMSFLDNISTRINPVGYFRAQHVQTLYICQREDFVHQYTIRRAVEEDNDDLVDIIPKILEDTYGEYYISELLAQNNEERQIIVAEFRGCAVGVLCLNGRVNYDLLNQHFHLTPFNGLRKIHELDELPVGMSDTQEVGNVEEIKDFTQILVEEDAKSEQGSDVVSLEDKELADNDDDISLVSLTSSLIFDMHIDRHELELLKQSPTSDEDGSDESLKSENSKFSTLLLNSDWEYKDSSLNRWDSEYSYKRSVQPVRRTVDEVSPTFYGDPNAVAIEISAALPGHEACLYLLLQAAFQCFPDRDYIIVSFPTNSCLCYLKKIFSRVAPMRASVFDHELYLLHKNAILGTLTVRDATPQDIEPVKNLLSTINNSEPNLASFSNAIMNIENPTKAYVFLCEEDIIGCATLGEECNQEYLEYHYSVEIYTSTDFCRFGTYGQIHHVTVSPIFQRQMCFFLRELHKLSDFSIIFYRLNIFSYTHVVGAITHMQPVLANKKNKISARILEEFSMPEVVTMKQPPYALFISSMPLTSLPRIDVSHRIVVVGGSATAMAFLRSLIFGGDPNSMVVFTNVTLVTLHAVYQKRFARIQEMVFVVDDVCTFCPLDTMDQTFLKTYINRVNGMMTKIDRKNKLVQINDRTCVPYDYLFLMCGEQFQTPLFASTMVFPGNVYIINTVLDASRAFQHLKEILTSIRKSETPVIVVYGHYIEALCCMAALLESGLKGKSLIYIDPPPEESIADNHDHQTNYFNNKHIEMRVFAELFKKGITIYTNYKIVDWTVNKKTGFITNATFESHSKIMIIEVTAMFMYHLKAVSRTTYQAIHNSGLVINGNLVIDKFCRTRDPCIYAAGPLTMYSKKYHAEHLMHKYFSGDQIGSELGAKIRNMLTPPQFRVTKHEHKPIKNHPKVRYAVFPGKLYYLKVYKPGKPIPLDIAMANSSYGTVLITGDLDRLEKQPFFRLHLNQYDTIETLTCLSKNDVNVSNLISLYGRHESLFNNLLARYSLQMIPDLYEYFNEPWLGAIFHPKFDLMMDSFEKMWASLKTDDQVLLIDAIKNILAEHNWNAVSEMTEEGIVEICTQTQYFRVIEEKLLKFIYRNHMYLPMYVDPMLIRWILHTIECSPLFVKDTFFQTTVTSNLIYRNI